MKASAGRLSVEVVAFRSLGRVLVGRLFVEAVVFKEVVCWSGGPHE